jgi:hypothetical protein
MSAMEFKLTCVYSGCSAAIYFIIQAIFKFNPLCVYPQPPLSPSFDQFMRLGNSLDGDLIVPPYALRRYSGVFPQIWYNLETAVLFLITYRSVLMFRKFEAVEILLSRSFLSPCTFFLLFLCMCRKPCDFSRAENGTRFSRTSQLALLRHP